MESIKVVHCCGHRTEMVDPARIRRSMAGSRFRPLGAVPAGMALLLGVGLETGLVAGPASTIQVQHSNPAGKGRDS
jgi:hypothetical protein